MTRPTTERDKTKLKHAGQNAFSRYSRQLVRIAEHWFPMKEVLDRNLIRSNLSNTTKATACRNSVRAVFCDKCTHILLITAKRVRYVQQMMC